MSTVPYTPDIKNTDYSDVVLLSYGLTKHEKVSDLADTAWHTSAWTSGFQTRGHIIVEYHCVINLDSIKSALSATGLTLTSASLKTAQSYGGVSISSKTTAKVLLDGSPLGVETWLQPAGYPNWSENGLGVSGNVFSNHTLEFIIHLELDVSGGWIDWYFGALTVNFQVTSLLTFNNVYVDCQMPAGSLDGIRVMIGNDVRLTDMTGRVATPFSLVNGSYTAHAKKTIDSTVYSGKISFVVPVPYGEVPVITLTAPPPYLPWWLIPVVIVTVATGGVVTLGALVGRRQQPPVYVIK